MGWISPDHAYEHVYNFNTHKLTRPRKKLLWL